jgi:hypothetical protein
MPIRQRGPSWQVDVRLPMGKRYRTTVATEKEAIELEASLKTNPQQRRAMTKLLRSQKLLDATNPKPALCIKPSKKPSEKKEQQIVSRLET